MLIGDGLCVSIATELQNNYENYAVHRSRDSVGSTVSIATGYGLDEREVGVPSPCES
jgi:hypothetical protein